MNKETLFEALADVGDDLLVMAERKRFVSPWRKWGQLAAVVAVVCCVGVLALPYLPVGCGGTESIKTSQDAAVSQTLTQECATETCEEELIEEAFVTDSEPEQAVEDTEQLMDGAQTEVLQEEKTKAAARELVKAVCRSTYFYLEPDALDQVPPLGEELGWITASDDPELVGCRMFTVPYSTWFTNYAVDDLPVTQMVYVQTRTGYRYGTTCNEKTVSRFTAEDVKVALEEENYQWLTATFVLPIEATGGVTFTQPSELSSEELNRIFCASTVMNTGVTVRDYWFDETGSYVVPVSQVGWRLERFLDPGYTYEPEQTEHYDETLDALVLSSYEVATWEIPEVAVFDGRMLDETRVLLLAETAEEQRTSKEYIIRFDDDSWRYETIRELETE